MGDADVDRLSRGLDGFGERIIDDDWAGQARDLQALRHGGLA
jgi:predicted flap endonuclease-1-like 5' DNA nuclease